MKLSKLTTLAFALTFGFSALASANCADDAINTCNTKHPDPNQSNHAYELYELCIKAQLGQQCPNSAINTSNLLIKQAPTKSRFITKNTQFKSTADSSTPTRR